MKNKRVIGSSGVLLAVLAGSIPFLIGATGESGNSEDSVKDLAHSVEVEEINEMQVEERRSFPGIIKGAHESALSFRVGGPLIDVAVEPGKSVKKGDLLMKIDSRDFEDRILSLEAELDGAEANWKKAKRDYERTSKLFKEQVVADSAFDAAQSAYESQSASVKRLRAQLQIARHALEDTNLFAPYDGVMTRQLAENHEMVQAGQVVLQFRDIQSLEVTIHMTENDMVHHSMRIGSLAKVQLPSLPEKEFIARLKEWQAEADPMTRTYAVTFEFSSPEGINILPGMSAEISWADEFAQRDVIAVPMTALCKNDDGSSFVWVYDADTQRAKNRVVETGSLVADSRVIVTSGVQGGDQVVVAGSRFIHEGLQLNAIN